MVNFVCKKSENIAWTRVNRIKCSLDFPNKEFVPRITSFSNA